MRVVADTVLCLNRIRPIHELNRKTSVQYRIEPVDYFFVYQLLAILFWRQSRGFFIILGVFYLDSSDKLLYT